VTAVRHAPRLTGACATPRAIVTLLLAIAAGAVLGGGVSTAAASIAAHPAGASESSPLARVATLSSEAEEEDEEEAEETAAVKMREEAAAMRRHDEEELTASRQREEEAATEKAAEKVQVERAKASGASVRIEKVAVAASSLVVTVEISRGGTVTITGPGLNKTVRTLAASTHDVKVTFADAGRAGDRHRHRIKVAVSLEPRSRKVSSSKEVRV
jgi:hypothetical protein